MKLWTLSAAALIFLAAPALAQDHDHGGGEHGGGHPGGGAHVEGGHAPAAGARPAAAAERAAPPAASMRRQDFVRGGGDRADRPAAGTPDHARAGFDADRGGAGRDNRNGAGNDTREHKGFNAAGRDDNRADHNGFDRNTSGNRFNDNRGVHGNGFQSGGRHDFSGVRNFHRNFNAARRFHAPSYRRPSGFYYHRWTWGETLPNAYWSQDYWLDDYEEYSLPPPPPGAVWVRYGNDALLIDQDSGEVIEAEYNVFY